MGDMPTSASIEGRLVKLPAETWGQQFRRARGSVSLTQAAANLSRVAWPVSHMVIARMESRDDPPTSRSQQVLAALFLLSYGVDPAELGLDIDVIPQSIDVEQVILINRCIAGFAASAA